MSDQTDITVLAEQITADSLAKWTDNKRKDFVATFDARVRVSRYILLKTADYVMEKAKTKHFISEKHIGEMVGRVTGYRDYETHYRKATVGQNSMFDTSGLYDRVKDDTGNYIRQGGPYLVGGRSLPELNAIAEQRAEEIVEQLPTLTDAVRIIDPNVANMISERAHTLEEGKALLEQSKEISGELDMADMDQSMTITAFRGMIKKRDKERRDLLDRMNELGAEGIRLNDKINKFLYDGLPGLSEAVIKVITDFVERATALAGFGRRVTEQVMFGDSAAAMEMLKSFEKDEVKVSSEIKSQFDEALEKLKLSAKKVGSKPEGGKLGAGKK